MSGCGSKVSNIYTLNEVGFETLKPVCGDGMENKLLQQMIAEGLKEQNILGEDAILHCDLVYYHKGNMALRHFVGFGAGKGKSLTDVIITKDDKELHKFSVTNRLLKGAGARSTEMIYSSAYEIVHYVKKNIMHQKVVKSELNSKLNSNQRKIYGY